MHLRCPLEGGMSCCLVLPLVSVLTKAQTRLNNFSGMNGIKVLKLGEVNPESSLTVRAELTLSMQLLQSREVTDYDAFSRITHSATILEVTLPCFSYLFESSFLSFSSDGEWRVTYPIALSLPVAVTVNGAAESMRWCCLVCA